MASSLSPDGDEAAATSLRKTKFHGNHSPSTKMVSKRKMLLSDFLTDVLLISGLRIFVKILDYRYSTKMSWETDQSSLSGFSAEMRLGPSAGAASGRQTLCPSLPITLLSGAHEVVWEQGWQLRPMPHTSH